MKNNKAEQIIDYKLTPVICSYSFDSDITVHLCVSQEDAIAYIKAEAEKEYKLEVEQNGRIPDEEIRLEFSDDGMTATITDISKPSKNVDGDNDITTWQVGMIID